MKTIIFIIIFSCSNLSQSIEYRYPRPFGHWPLQPEIKNLAVIPMLNKKIVSADLDEKERPNPLDPTTELLKTSLTGLVALTPHFLISYY